MDGAAAAAAADTDTAAPKKRARGKRKKSSAGTADLVLRAVSANKDRKGMSYYSLKRAMAAQGYDVESNNFHIKRVVKAMVSKGVLLQTKGFGALGSFKVNKKAAKPKSGADKAAAVKPKAATPQKSEKPVGAGETSPRKAIKKAKKKKEA